MNLRVGVLSGLLLLSAFAVVAPPAAAQAQACGAAGITCATTTVIEITPPSQPIKPLGPFQAIQVTVKYTYLAAAPVTFASSSIELAVTNAPPWVVTTLSPQTVYIPVSQAAASQDQRTETQQAFLLVSTTADAPAFTQGNIEITANAKANGALLASSAKNSIPVQADFFSIIEAITPQNIQKAKPQAEVAYPVTVTNFGNAITKVEFSVDSQPEKWQVTLPSPITLQARQTGQSQNTRTVPITIQTPFQNGYLNVVGAITVRLKSNYALDPKIVGDQTTVSTLTTTKGFYVPGFEPVLMLGAVGAMALLVNQQAKRKR